MRNHTAFLFLVPSTFRPAAIIEGNDEFIRRNESGHRRGDELPLVDLGAMAQG